MEKRLRNYLDYMKRFTSVSHTDEECKVAYEDLMIQIAFFQHERLIHLMVTLAFAIFTISGIVASMFVQQIPVLVMTLLFLCLLIPYVRHYYILENGVQELYTRYDYLFAVLHKTTK
ncbi:MAG: hypothetical protein K6G69_00270 [Lachnospiraceae bacterium]|nr:hypothetical protein [Lachnospiraceae bacterium]